jgi:LPXTG-site transpeptidase (sortase) family protein
MKIAMMDAPDTYDYNENNDINPEVINEINTDISDDSNYEIDYSKYLGVLEIPKISLKRGFYNIGSKYNNIQYNVTMVEGSTLPDVESGNLILMAHSGDAYISYFAYLYKLNIGDMVYVTYAGRKYEYQIVNIYEVEKNGAVVIKRNYDKTSLTMITCTKDNDYTQTVYISELVG